MKTSVTQGLSDDDIDRLLSVEKAAELLSVSPWTVRKMISTKKMRSAKLGARRLVPKSEIMRLISNSLGESHDKNHEHDYSLSKVNV